MKEFNLFLIICIFLKNSKSEPNCVQNQNHCQKCNPVTHLRTESGCDAPTNTCTTNTQCNQENACMICDSETNSCKNGCELLAYLKGDKKSYIRTDLSINDLKKSITNFDLTFEIVEKYTQIILGNGYNMMQMPIIYNSGSFYLRGDWVAGQQIGNVGNVVVGTKCTLSQKDGYLTFNDTTTQITKEITSSGKIGLFGKINGTGTETGTLSNGKIYRFKGTNMDTGEMLFDYVPVLAPKQEGTGQEPAMFDRVSKKLFYNSGTGTFDYGPKSSLDNE